MRRPLLNFGSISQAAGHADALASDSGNTGAGTDLLVSHEPGAAPSKPGDAFASQLRTSGCQRAGPGGLVNAAVAGTWAPRRSDARQMKY